MVNTTYETLLNDTILNLGGYINDYALIDEDSEDAINDIENCISGYKLSLPNGGIIFNFLRTEKCFQAVYNAYNTVMNSTYDDIYESTKKYTIVSISKTLWSDLDLDLSAGHYEIISCYSDENTASNIWEIGVTVFGEGYTLSTIESRGMVSFEIIVQAYLSTHEITRDAIFGYIENNPVLTSFGNLKLPKYDTSLSLPISAAYYDNNGNLQVIDISENWPSETYRRTFNLEEYKICNRTINNGESYVSSSISMLFLLSLTGQYAAKSNALIAAYLAATDYVNNNGGISGRMILPQILNTLSESENAIQYIKEAISKYNTNILFGLSDSQMRKDIIPYLKEYNLLLFYPYDYEGYECDEHIIYMGRPYNELNSVISYIYRSISTNIFILYSDNYLNNLAALNAEYEFEKKGISVIRSLRIPMENYQINVIISIILNEMTNGVILSFLEGDAATEFIKAVSKDYPNIYTIVSFNVLLNDIVDDTIWKYFDGHYFIKGIDRSVFNNNDVYSIIDEKYTFIQEQSSAAAIMSVLAIKNALDTLEYNDEPNELPYSFEDILTALHNVTLDYVLNGVKINSNNQFSLYVKLVKLEYNSQTKKCDENVIFEIEKSTVNPYSSQYNNNHKIYYCEWNNDTGLIGEKIQSNTKMVAMLFSITGTDSQYELTSVDILISSIDVINKENKLNGIYLDYEIFDVTNENNIPEIAQKIALDDSYIFVIGCSTDSCRTTVSSNFAQLNPKKTLWYTKDTHGEECLENVFYTGLLPSLYVNQISAFIRQLDIISNLFLIGNNNNYDETIHNIFKGKLGTLYNIIGDVYVDSGIGTTTTYADELVSNHPEGAIIIITLDKVTTIDFINYLETIVYNNDIFVTIAIGQEEDIVTELKLTGVINHYLTGSYFTQIDTECDFKKINDDYYGVITSTETAHSCYIAINLWANAVKSVGYEDTNLLRKSLYKSRFTSCTGSVMMFSNNHISLPYYIMRITTDLKLQLEFSQVRTQEPLAYSWYIPGSNKRICDFESIGESGTVNTFNILLAISSSGYFKDNDMYVEEMFELMVENINNNKGGVLDTRIVLETYDIASDDDTCIDFLSTYLDETSSGVIFTTASTVCLKALASDITENDVPIFVIGYATGEFSNKNIFFTLKEPTYVDQVIDYVINPTDPDSMKFCVIASSGDPGADYQNYIEKYVERYGATIEFSTLFSLDTTNFTSIVRNMIKKAPNGCNIIFIGTSNIHVLYDEAAKNLKLDTTKYQLISLTTASNAVSKGVKQFISAQAYFTNLENDENTLFKEDTLYLSTYATEIMYAGYIGFNIWVNSVERCRNIFSSSIRDVIYDLTYESPSGSISMNVNNYVKQYLMIGKMIENDDNYGFDLLLTSKSTILPVVWKTLLNDGLYRCDFKDSSIGTKYRYSTITVGILTSFTGKYNITERAITYGILEAIRELNEDGGVINYEINIMIRDAQSELSKYIEYAGEFVRLDEVELVFGGGIPSIYKELGPYFDQNKKLYFYPGLSTSESCYKYSYSTQSTPNQLINGVWKYIIPYVTNIYVIEDDDIWSLQVSRGIEELCDVLNIKFYIYNLTDLINNKVDNFNVKNLDKNSAVILSVSEDNNIVAFNWLCDNELNNENTYVVSLSLDRYFMEYIPAKCLKGAYILTTFIEEMGKSTSDSNTYLSAAENFVENMNNRYGEAIIVTAAMESGYTAVKLWSDVVIAYTLSLDSEKVRQALYGYTIESVSGTVSMNTASLLNRIIYLCKIDENKILSVTDYASNPEEAEAWINFYPENEGYICDWSVVQDRYRPDSMKLLFFHETNEVHEKEIKSMIMEFSLVQDINNNGIDGNKIIPIFIFGSSKEDFENKTSKYYGDSEVISVFGCKTDYCSENALNFAKHEGKLYVYYSLLLGQSCYPYRLSVGTTASQRFSAADYYLNDQGLSTFIFVSDGSDKMISYYQMVSYYVKNHFSTKKQTVSRVDIKNENEIEAGIASIAKKLSDSSRVALLYYLSGDLSNKFLESYISNGYSSREILITFMDFDSSDYTNEILSSVYGSYVILSYEETLSTANSQSFVSDAQGYLGINTNIDEDYESIKDAFLVWENIIETAITDSGNTIPPLRYIQLSSVDVTIQVPSGELQIEESLYSSRNSYVFEINKNAKFIQLFPSRGSNYIFSADPYPEGLPNECKFGKEEVFYKNNMVIVGISYGLFGLSVVCGIAGIVFVFVHSRQSIIKTLGRAHNYFLSIGIFILPFSTITMIIQPTPTNGICVMRVVILAFATKYILAVLLATETKLWYKKKRIHGTIRKTKVTVFRILKFLIPFLLFEAILLILWFMIQPNEYSLVYSVTESDYFSEVSIRECKESSIFLYKYLILE